MYNSETILQVNVMKVSLWSFPFFRFLIRTHFHFKTYLKWWFAYTIMSKLPRNQYSEHFDMLKIAELRLLAHTRLHRKDKYLLVLPFQRWSHQIKPFLVYFLVELQYLCLYKIVNFKNKLLIRKCKSFFWLTFFLPNLCLRQMEWLIGWNFQIFDP